MATARRSNRTLKTLAARDICEVLGEVAPPELAADWDNVGLLIGDASSPVRRLLLTIDLTEAVLAEAARASADMVMAYHPPIFKALTKLTTAAAPVVWAAARAGLAVYSMHTALDAAPGGTNDVLAEAVGVVDAHPLAPAPAEGQCKLVVFAPPGDLPAVASAAFAAGAGRIGNYSECSFAAPGTGTFLGGAGSSPAVGRAGRRERSAEVRLEAVVPRAALAEVVSAIREAHSYETPAIDVYALEPVPCGGGMGRVGRLRRPVGMKAFIARVKRALGVPRVLVAGRAPRRVTTVAVGAGSCGDLCDDAARAGADVFVTGEMRHHQALAAAAAGLTVVCVGHSNSERLTLGVLAKRIRTALPGLKVKISRKDRDPFDIA